MLDWLLILSYQGLGKRFGKIARQTKCQARVRCQAGDTGRITNDDLNSGGEPRWGLSVGWEQRHWLLTAAGTCSSLGSGVGWGFVSQPSPVCDYRPTGDSMLLPCLNEKHPAGAHD